MGDDLPDFEVMKMAGFAACPSDAATEIREISAYISHRSGGEGCVRDIIEQVLRLHNKWMNDFSFVW
jgi:3-deoxy-D-manno-octulosonate 8-phosphate phosphatase (KDO 8-P phosphatase)